MLPQRRKHESDDGRTRPFLITLSLCLLFVSTTLAQEKGMIAGTVVDETGAPVIQATVNADPLGARARASLVRYVETDSKGQFLIDRLEWGKYAVFAMKEESSYPNLGMSFYGNDVFPTATITPSSPIAELHISLGPRAAIITGSVTNAISGAPLNSGFKHSCCRT
jgi:hypothetical protein